MSVSADSFEKLSEKVDDAKRRIRAAASESEAELKAKVEEARKNADDSAAELSAKTGATAGKAEAHWQQIQSDWEQHRQGIRQRIDQAKEAQDIEDARLRAEWADADATAIRPNLVKRIGVVDGRRVACARDDGPIRSAYRPCGAHRPHRLRV